MAAYTSINKPTDNFRTKLYTGNGSARSITFDESTNMQPDLMWLKGRNTTASWLCNDVLRGATKRLKLDANSAESTETGMISSFDTNGFSLGTTSTSNNNGSNYVAYSWKAAGAGSSNGDGTTTSTVSVNTAAGCSLVQYAGASSAKTIGHGLGVTPDLMIVKTYSSGYEWAVYHKDLGAGKNLYLDSNGGASNTTTFWNNTAPTNQVFSAGGQIIYTNYSGQNYIAYCFASKRGYSRIGTYEGNGSSDGTFVYTGFKPAWVLIKQSSASGEEWQLLDNKRNTFNPTNTAIFPSDTAVENSGTDRSDFLSNGFKLRSNSAGVNASGATYVYAAFAEEPLVDSTGKIPTTAR